MIQTVRAGRLRPGDRLHRAAAIVLTIGPLDNLGGSAGMVSVVAVNGIRRLRFTWPATVPVVVDRPHASEDTIRVIVYARAEPYMPGASE